MISRRTMLVGGGATIAGLAAGLSVWGVEERVLPGRSALNHALHLDGPAGQIPTDTPGPIRRGVMASAAVRADVGWQVAYPPGTSDSLPVVISLHGLDGDHTSSFDSGLHLDRFLAAHILTGGTPFAIASVDGGASTYWHERADGTNAAAMVTDEFVPLLDGLGLDTSRCATFGWSMGGYGAMLIAASLKQKVVAAVASSPAQWKDFDQVLPNAFDDQPQFERNSLFSKISALDGLALRIDCGTDDAFFENTELLRNALEPTPAGGFQSGGHRMEYWTRMVPAQLEFIGHCLR